MTNLTRALLSSAAFAALAVSPSAAGVAPRFHVQALRGGHAVNKTRLHDQKRQHVTYTVSVSTGVSASDLKKVVPLVQTFYRWISYSSCGGHGKARSWIQVPKKSSYGKLGSATETYSACGYENIYYGDTYKLLHASDEGKTDHFRSVLYGKFRNGNGDYKGTLNIDVTVPIGTE